MSYYNARKIESPERAKFGLQSSESPIKTVIEENELWKSRCRELESSLCQINSDLEIANFKAKKAFELEEKVDMVLKHNAQLLGENDALVKTLSQKKTESDVWRQKYEAQMNSLIQMKAGYELDIKRLTSEIAKLKEDVNATNVDRVRSVEETRARAEVDAHATVQALRRSHAESSALYEEQLRKLRDIVESREREIAVYQLKLAESKNEGELNATRLVEDREKLLMKMSQIEVENHRDKELSKSHALKQHREELQNLREQYEQRLDVLEGETVKLKGLLELKNHEIDNWIQQNRLQKLNADDEASALRAEIQDLKNKIAEINDQHFANVEELKERLANQHVNDLNGLRFAHDNQIDTLNAEIAQLKAIIDDKQREVEGQITEKLQQRQNYSQELDRLNKDVDMWKFKNHALDRQREKELFDAEVRLEGERRAAADQQKKQDLHILELDRQIEELRRLLDVRNRDADESARQYRAIRDDLEDQVKDLRAQLGDAQRLFVETRSKLELQVDDLRLQLKVSETEGAEQRTREKILLDKKEEEIRRLLSTIETKNNECVNLLQHRARQEDEIKALILEKDDLKRNVLEVEQQKIRELKDLHLKLEQTFELERKNIERTYLNRINQLDGIIRDHEVQLSLKESELRDYIQKYEKIELIIRDFVNNPERLRDRAEVATIKNLYESLRTSRGKSASRSPTKRSQIF